MIYLIGGAPRCGKTILSQRIAKRDGISWISTDTIRPMVMACTPKAQLHKKFPYEKLQFEDDAVPYQDMDRNSLKALLRAEITESNSIWPSALAMIMHLIDCNQNYVIEGVHLMPGLVAQLRGTKYWKHIRVIFLVKQDIRAITKGFRCNTSKHDWLAGVLTNEVLLEKAANMVQSKSVYIAKEAKKFHFRVINMDQNFEKKIEVLAGHK